VVKKVKVRVMKRVEARAAKRLRRVEDDETPFEAAGVVDEGEENLEVLSHSCILFELLSYVIHGTDVM
jgi:hypothetical protein